ncbi:hypothetical protein AB0933_32615 [Streptomyces venezuelae]|uniref:hypothetical protein n=1 Tax=Streptomyces venezuelae TaxID=54571 RepID=UPI0034569CD6
MAVMTHTQNPATTADYTALTATQQALFDAATTAADNADSGLAYFDAMADAAGAAGITLPASRDLARCSCLNDAGGCGCGAIFDSHLTGVVVTATHAPDRNLSELQCPPCGHDHPRPIPN